MTEREIEVIVGRLYLMVAALELQLEAARAKAVTTPVPPLALVKDDAK